MALNMEMGARCNDVGNEAEMKKQTVGSSSQADCLMRNSAMDDSIGGS
jgi:hypothetical protein